MIDTCAWRCRFRCRGAQCTFFDSNEWRCWTLVPRRRHVLAKTFVRWTTEHMWKCNFQIKFSVRQWKFVRCVVRSSIARCARKSDSHLFNCNAQPPIRKNMLPSEKGAVEEAPGTRTRSDEDLFAAWTLIHAQRHNARLIVHCQLVKHLIKWEVALIVPRSKSEHCTCSIFDVHSSVRDSVENHLYSNLFHLVAASATRRAYLCDAHLSVVWLHTSWLLRSGEEGY